MGYSNISALRHQTLILAQDKAANATIVEFEGSGARPRVEFTESFIVVGCHKVSREAWRVLNERYENYLGSRRAEVMQEGNY